MKNIENKLNYFSSIKEMLHMLYSVNMNKLFSVSTSVIQRIIYVKVISLLYSLHYASLGQTLTESLYQDYNSLNNITVPQWIFVRSRAAKLRCGSCWNKSEPWPACPYLQPRPISDLTSHLVATWNAARHSLSWHHDNYSQNSCKKNNRKRSDPVLISASLQSFRRKMFQFSEIRFVNFLSVREAMEIKHTLERRLRKITEQ